MKKTIITILYMMTAVMFHGCQKDCGRISDANSIQETCWNAEKGWYEPCGYSNHKCDYQQTEVFHNGVWGILYFASLMTNNQQSWYGSWYPYNYGYRTTDLRFGNSSYYYNNRNIQTRWYY